MNASDVRALRASSSEKPTLREFFKTQRREFKSNLADQALVQQLYQGLAPIKGPRAIWATYKALEEEANPEAITTLLPGSWAYPRISNNQIEFYLVSKETKWEKNGQLGILEPLSQESVAVDRIEGVLLPGLAFDRWGHRLGWGHSYYDRVLSHYEGLKVGVAYSVQVSREELPNETHDVAMDFIATEKEFSVVKG